MRLLWVLWCVVWVWVCHALPQITKMNMKRAQECEVYGSQGTAPSVIKFNRRISVGIMAHSTTSMAQLNLQSTITGKTCQIVFMRGSIVPICEHHSGPQQILNGGDTMELWMEVDGRDGDASTTVWNLKVVTRQGKDRMHLLIPDTSLEPPVNLWFNSSQNIQYYFNCITGCLFDKSVEMPRGQHSFYLRHDPGFTQMTLDAGVAKMYRIGNVSFPERESEMDLSGIMEDVKYEMKNLTINVTAAQLSSPGGFKEIEMVWINNLQDIGVLVDGAPVGNFTEYKTLDRKRQIKVKVTKGEGLVTSCNPDFQTVACSSDEEVTEAKTNIFTTTRPSTSAIIQPSQPHSSKWLPAVFAFVLLNCIVTVVAVGLAVILYRRYSSETHKPPQGNSEPSAIFSRKSSTRSSTRSTQRGSQRRKNKTDAAKEDQRESDSRSEGARAHSETVTTPLTTPAFPKTSKNVSTDEFVDLSLM